LNINYFQLLLTRFAKFFRAPVELFLEVPALRPGFKRATAL